MSLTLDEIIVILKNHSTDDTKLKSLEVFLKFVEITSVEVLNKITEPFSNKTLVFNLLYSKNMLSNVQTEHLQFFGFLTDTQILNNDAEMETLKRILVVSPDIIIDMLNFIRGTGKSDKQKLELIQEVLKSSNIFSELIKSVGQNDVARLMSAYFVDYNSYAVCCQLLEIDNIHYEEYHETIQINNDTMIFFGEHKLRYSQMTRGKWYSFDKELEDGTVIIYNLKKVTGSKYSYDDSPSEVTLAIEKNIVNKSKVKLISIKPLVINWSGKGYIIDEHSEFKEAK